MKISKIVMFLIVASLFLSCSSGIEAKQDRVCFDKTCFDVEIMKTSEELMRGMQHRDHLGSDSGMLFVMPNNDRYRFWMKETLIPLDIIWLDYTREVVYIESNVHPCEKDPCPSYGSDDISSYVLELNAGRAKEAGLKVGDKAKFYIK